MSTRFFSYQVPFYPLPTATAKMTMKRRFMSGLSIFLWLDTKATDVSGVKQADVSKKVKRFIFLPLKNILIFLERGELEFKFTAHNFTCVCAAGANKEASGWRLTRSGAILDL